MVTLHIAQLLEDEGFGTLDSTIFWEDMPLDANGKPIDGLWIVPRGAALSRFDYTTQSFDIYARDKNKVTSSRLLEDILEYLQTAYEEVCELPTVPDVSSTRYYDCRIQPTSAIENVGVDEQDKVVRVISGEIKYKKET